MMIGIVLESCLVSHTGLTCFDGDMLLLIISCVPCRVHVVPFPDTDHDGAKKSLNRGIFY